jgi:hypothetical protein
MPTRSAVSATTYLSAVGNSFVGIRLELSSAAIVGAYTPTTARKLIYLLQQEPPPPGWYLPAQLLPLSRFPLVAPSD